MSVRGVVLWTERTRLDHSVLRLLFKSATMQYIICLKSYNNNCLIVVKALSYSKQLASERGGKPKVETVDEGSDTVSFLVSWFSAYVCPFNCLL